MAGAYQSRKTPLESKEKRQRQKSRQNLNRTIPRHQASSKLFPSGIGFGHHPTCMRNSIRSQLQGGSANGRGLPKQEDAIGEQRETTETEIPPKFEPRIPTNQITRRALPARAFPAGFCGYIKRVQL